jgi:uncharacterized protein (DUF3820 family)
MGRQPASIPLARLSEQSRAVLQKMKTEGSLPAGNWPGRGSIPVPYKFKADAGVWTGTHVRLVFPDKLKPERQDPSSPAVVFLMSVDTAIAAAKAIPLGLIEKDRIFECRVVDDHDFSAMIEAKRRKLSPPLATMRNENPFRPGTGDNGGKGRPLFGGFAPQVDYDEEASVLCINNNSLNQFLDPDRVPAEGMLERQKLIRDAAVSMALGKYHDRIPASIRSAWATYFATIDFTLGPDLDYGKLTVGLKKLVKKGIPTNAAKEAEGIKFDPEAALADLAADRMPQGNNGALVIYYLLHLDGNRKAASLGTLLRTSLPEDEAIQLACDRYRADVAAFQAKAEAYNREMMASTTGNRAVHKTSDGRTVPDNSSPSRPVPPAASLGEFLESPAVAPLVMAAEAKRMKILLRNRSNSEIAADFGSMIEKAVR